MTRWTIRCCAVVAVMTACFVLSPHRASAGTAAQAMQAVMDCRRVAASAARLACYDRAAGSVTTEALAAPQFGRGGDSRPDFDPGKSLHERHPSGAEPAELKRVTAVLVRVGSHDGRPTFYLDNGQIWRAQEDDYVHINPALRNTATLSRSMLGISYMLRINNEHRVISVVREE